MYAAVLIIDQTVRMFVIAVADQTCCGRHILIAPAAQFQLCWKLKAWLAPAAFQRLHHEVAREERKAQIAQKLSVKTRGMQKQLRLNAVHTGRMK